MAVPRRAERRTAQTPVASTVPEPHGKPGGGLWGHPGLMAPPYIEHVAGRLLEQGHDESTAYHMAVGIVQNWAAGHDGHGNAVHPDVQAAAAKNIAQWEALKARYGGGKSSGRSATMALDVRAAISTADQNDLDDSDFAYIEPGGSKDSSGKTVPRSLRHFPIHDAAHVRNALSRAPQSPFGDKAMPKIKAAAKKFGIDSDGDGDGDRSSGWNNVERRYTSSVMEVRAIDDGQRIGGYAAVFGKLSRNLGGFVERVDSGAFNEWRSMGWPNVVCRYNHDSNMVLGTTASGMLQLRTDNVGLDYDVLPPQARTDILELVQRRDIQFSSFAFRVPEDGDTWSATRDTNYPMRTLHGVELVDVAPVLDPAYPDATAGLRSLARAMSASFDEVRTMAQADELRRFFVRTDRPSYSPPKPKVTAASAMMKLMERRRDPWTDQG